MAKGVALTIGLNFVDPKHYQGWDGELAACEADARDMAALAASKGFTVTTLLTKQATRAAVTKALAAHAKTLVAGTLLRVWNGGKFKGTYRAFHRAILNKMPPDQSPNYFKIGKPSAKFSRQKPFTV